MAWYEMKGAGLPAGLQASMDSVLNKKFGTSTTYAPATWPDNVNLLGPLPEKTVSGAIASFSDGADDVPIKSASFGIVASGGNGTPSTPVPIVGKSSVTVYHGKKNFFKPLQTTGSNRQVDYTPQSDGGVKCYGTASAYSYVSTEGVLPKGSFIISGGKSGVGIQVRRKSDNTAIVSQANDNPVTFTMSEETEVYFNFYVNNGTTVDVTIYAQIEVGNQATTYETYRSKTPITVSLGRTIYGGSVDVVQGTGTDGYSGLVALNSKQWNKTTVSGHTAFYCSLSDGYMVTGADNFGGACSSYDVTTDTTLANDKVIRFYYNSSYNISRAIIRDDQYENLTGAEFQAVVTGNMVYMLNEASETPFTFTPTPINSYLGDNNIWCDTGDSEVTYRADINLALQALQGNRSLGLMMSRPDPEEPEETEPEEPEER